MLYEKEGAGLNSSAKRVAYLAVFTAVGVIFVLLANIVPTGKLALLAVASLPVCAALLRYGPGWAAGVFAVTAALGLLLLPGTAAIGYAGFFGWYPVVKSLCERLQKSASGLILKYAAYSLAFMLYWFLAKSLLFGGGMPWYGLYIIGAAAFYVYDWAYSLLIQFYIDKLARFLK